MEKCIMIKYGELTTKKANRKMFIQTLENNILKILEGLDVQIKKDRVRMYIKSNNIEEVLEKLKKVFGLHGIVIVNKVESKEEKIEEGVLSLVKDADAKTFKIECKRADKTFPIKSGDMNHKLGGIVLKNTNLKVDVHTPDITIFVEIRREGTFLYTNEVRGIGGYPVGIQGRGLLMLSGGIDSPVAGYLALKRGVSIDCIYFESPPHTSIEAKEKVKKLAGIINEYSKNIRLFVVPFTKIQEEIYKKVEDSYVITIMRRMMYRIAEEVAYKYKSKVIINGESIGQVASQTLTSISVINEVVKMPVIRPVACMDKIEIIDLAKQIGTYDTSILPYEDCCTVFVPKHPVIHPELKKCILLEEKIEYETLIKEAIENIEIITSFKDDFSEYL